MIDLSVNSFEYSVCYSLNNFKKAAQSNSASTKYKKPIIIGRKIFGYGRIVRSEGRRTYATSEILNEEGEIVALADAVFVEVKVPKDNLTDQITGNEKHLELSEKDPKEL